MKISSLKHFFSSAFKSLIRNRTLSGASIITVTLTSFLFGILLLTMMNANGLIKNVESKIEIEIFLNDDATVENKMDLETKLNSIESVNEIVFVTKEDALNEFKRQLGEDNQGLIQGFEENNPLPESYVVKVASGDAIKDIITEIDGMIGIKKVKDDVELVNQITSFTNGMKLVGAIIMIILMPVSLFLIMNTIKLAVFSRRKEIGIMKYVGATDAFIRWPFVIEGMIIGFLGTGIAVILLNNVYILVFNKLTGMVKGGTMIMPNQILTSVTIYFLIGGCFIGILGSMLSLRKFLKV
ncbi:permease-like cell division protein FtsX [Clostridium grantii]|uniref:Cell division protein FtsX n=1 Tax=Clostridium grantii DSM 8605 TaxID=1121316 RepID=A0A1M5U520_9CLOT|nr:permease-like cell division protein FtsX [Clostridium grantii]SHH58038.1 cell division protein FtsX [Clostridium grantii DSM 8605]